MSIAFESSDDLEQLRSRLRKMSDDELVRFGKAARSLCRDLQITDSFMGQVGEAHRGHFTAIKRSFSRWPICSIASFSSDVDADDSAARPGHQVVV